MVGGWLDKWFRRMVTVQDDEERGRNRLVEEEIRRKFENSWLNGECGKFEINLLLFSFSI